LAITFEPEMTESQSKVEKIQFLIEIKQNTST